MQIVQSVLASQPSGLVFDIDGTLSPIAPTPDAASLYPGVAALLEQARAYAQVAIITGREITDGAAMVNIEGLTYIGIHGVEWCEGLPATHTVSISPEALPYIEPGQRLLDLAEQKLANYPGVMVERKRLGGSVHYRLARDPEQAHKLIMDTLREPAHAHHFLLSSGKRVIDIKPAFAINKGQALRSFVERFKLASVLFAGDDRTDLDAILEIERLRQEGYHAAAITVQAADTLPELLEHADLVVQGVEGMARLLQDIVASLQARSAASQR